MQAVVWSSTWAPPVPKPRDLLPVKVPIILRGNLQPASLVEVADNDGLVQVGDVGDARAVRCGPSTHSGVGPEPTFPHFRTRPCT